MELKYRQRHGMERFEQLQVKTMLKNWLDYQDHPKEETDSFVEISVRVMAFFPPTCQEKEQVVYLDWQSHRMSRTFVFELWYFLFLSVDFE